MQLTRQIRMHLGWRVQQGRRLYRNRLFDLAARSRSVVRTRDHHGNTYLVATHDPSIGRSVYVNGQYDAAKISVVLDVLDAHGIEITRVLDIGANIGTTTIELLTRLPRATAECFEPEPFNHWLLSRNIEANGLRDRTRLHRIALSDANGAISFEIAPDNPGDHRVRVTDVDGAFGEASRATIMVDARRLDSLGIPLDEHTLTCVDVQSHEWNVLAGAPGLVGPITLEFWPYGLARAGTLDSLIDHLGGMGAIFDITVEARQTDAAALAKLATDHDLRHIRDLLVLPRMS